jgi:CHAT domain-containing protein/Tfp pilus assembly protein PilF
MGKRFNPVRARQLLSISIGFVFWGSTVAIPLKAVSNELVAQASYGDSIGADDEGLILRKADQLMGQGNLLLLEKYLGPDQLEAATGLRYLGILYIKHGQHEKAERLLARSIAILRKTFKSDHPFTATVLSSLAILYESQGRYSEAEPLFSGALEIRKEVLGESLDTAESIQNLAVVYFRQSKYDKAESYFSWSLAAQEKLLGKQHHDVAETLSNLGSVYIAESKYQKALAVLTRSLAILEKQHGGSDLAIANTLNNLAVLSYKKGRFSNAAQLYNRSLSIREKHLAPDSPDLAETLNNLALVYYEQGDYEKATGLCVRSLAIREKALGLSHPDVAESLSNLALIYYAQGKYLKLESVYERSIAIRKNLLGPDHPEVAASLSNLGLLYLAEGRPGQAGPLFSRALAIRNQVLGPFHPDVALSLANLAQVYLADGKLDQAKDLFARSLALFEKSLPPGHRFINSSHFNMARVYVAKGEARNAIFHLDSGLARQFDWVSSELPFLDKATRVAQLRSLGEAWQMPFSIVYHFRQGYDLALTSRLNRHGLLQEIERRQIILASTPSMPQDKVDKLRELINQSSSVTLPLERRVALKDERDRLQAELYRALPELQIQPVSTAMVAKALPVNGALIELQRFTPFNGRKLANQPWGESHYLALILKPDGSIQSVQLGPAAPIDAAVQKGLAATAQNQSDSKAIWGQLSDLVLRPLLPQLDGSRQWFLSPDGELNRVPFAALPSPQQSDVPLAEAVQLRQLTTGRDLLRLQQPAAKGMVPVVFANPSYDRSGQAAPRPAAAGEEPIAQQRSSDLGSKAWAPLPATAQEGQRVAQQLSGRLFTGPEASTTRLEQLQNPRILHIATHGFFVADAEAKPDDPLRVIQDDSMQLKGLRQKDPQLRSGLVLAGANQPDANPNDDGYLTAAEAVTLNLKGTELVVLSACSTGQGDIRTGEGVYGLQRSLAVAGARSTLLSLWKVDDGATLEFMTRFYKRLKSGEGRSDALATTQKEFRAGIPGKPEWKEPYYWAAWQLVGDWRPIPGL